MDGKSKARAAALIVLTIAAGASVAAMFFVGGAYNAFWFWTTAAGWLVALTFFWWLAGLLGRSERMQMPSRPAALPEAAPVSSRATVASNVSVTNAVVFRPSSLAAASLSNDMESENEGPMIEVPPVSTEPAGYVMRGFTLYERTQKGQPVRFFSKKGPVGGGRAIPLPEGYDARWDTKQKKPVLVPPKPAEPLEPAPAESPLALPDVETPTARALAVPKAAPSLALDLPQHTAKPCSAMTSPGVFCSNPAKAGGAYCSRHVDYKAAAVLEPKLEVAHDAKKGNQGKAPKFAMPAFEVQRDRIERKPTKPSVAKKAKPTRETPEFEVHWDRAARPLGKPSKTGKKAGGPDASPRFEVQLDRPEHKPPKPKKTGKKPHEVQLEIQKDEAHIQPLKLASAFDAGQAKVVLAKGGATNGRAQKPPRKLGPATGSFVVEKDSKKRTMAGLEAAPARRSRKR